MAKVVAPLLPGLASLDGNPAPVRSRDAAALGPALVSRPQPVIGGLKGTGAPLNPAPTPAPAAGPALPTGLQRSIDGSGNDLRNPTENSLGSTFRRLGPARFADGASSLRQDLPNARLVSNLVVAGQGETPNREGLSGMMYAWATTPRSTPV